MTSYFQYAAAMLEPDAIEAMQRDTFSYAVASNVTKLLITSWQTRLGSSGRMEQRSVDNFLPLRGVTLTGTGSGSTAVIIDPSLPTYADAQATYYDRLAQIMELPTRYIGLSGASQFAPMLPGAYGAIIVQATSFDLAWTAFQNSENYGSSMYYEISDAAAGRQGNAYRFPWSKRVAGQVFSSSYSNGSPVGGFCFVLVPSDWSVIADPVSSSYSFRDDFMGASLDTGSTWTRAQSTTGNVEIDGTYQWCRLWGNSSWGSNGLHSQASFARSSEPTIVVDVYCPRGAESSGWGNVGWSDGAGHSYSNMAHCVNFQAGIGGPTNLINVYENGTLRGNVGTTWTRGGIYRIKIKALSGGGATYSIQGGVEYPAIGSASWTNITPGTTSSGTNTLYAGATAWAAQPYISDVRVF